VTSRSVLISGTSTGIGEACALRLADRGWHVFAGVRREEDGKRLAAAATGILEPVMLDVTDAASIEEALRQVGDRLTAVVNNAGVVVGGPVEYLAVDEWRHQYEVNVIGHVAVTVAALPLIRAAGPGGRVVFMGSIGGRISTPLLAPYDSSKFALEAIAESLRHELAPAGIKVVLIEPAGIRTPIWEKGRRRADEMEAALPPEALSRYQWAVDGIRKNIDMQIRNGVPPARVAEAVEQALTSSRPRARYLVGRDAKVMAAIDRLLPDSARDFLVRMATKP
jgi:NAD(P)-dependent dehydrogenase (short-subunit alcohol dehydrogenase family)